MNVDALRAVGFCKCFSMEGLVKVHPNTPNSRQIKGESYKEIDQLQIGDRVLSANEHTGELSYRPVTELFVHDVKLIHRLTYKEGLTIETTWNHPFWVQDKGWTEAKDLHAGERSVTARSILKGKQPRLQTVSFTSNVQPGFDDPSMVTWDDAREGTLSVARVEEVHRADKVYNIEVEGNHTYFVTEEGVLVHNYQYESGLVEDGDTYASILKTIRERHNPSWPPFPRSYVEPKGGQEIALWNGLDPDKPPPVGMHVLSPEQFDALPPDQKAAFIHENLTGKRYVQFSVAGDGTIGASLAADAGVYYSEHSRGIFRQVTSSYFGQLNSAVRISLPSAGVGIAMTEVEGWDRNDYLNKTSYSGEVCFMAYCGGIIHDSSMNNIGSTQSLGKSTPLPVPINIRVTPFSMPLITREGGAEVEYDTNAFYRPYAKVKEEWWKGKSRWE